MYPRKERSVSGLYPAGSGQSAGYKDCWLNCSSSTPSTSTTLRPTTQGSSTPSTSTTHRRLKDHLHRQRLNTTPLTKGSSTSSAYNEDTSTTTTQLHLRPQRRRVAVKDSINPVQHSHSLILSSISSIVVSCCKLKVCLHYCSREAKVSTIYHASQEAEGKIEDLSIHTL